MADIRPKDLLPTAESMAEDDYLLLDGATKGTRKILGGSLVQELGTRQNVVNEGAVGDGLTNNASVFARLFGTPGAYYVPAGRYVVKLASDYSDLIKIASGVDILVDPLAIIEFTEPAVPGFVLFEQTGVRIQGGVFEFAGVYTHEVTTGALQVNGTDVNAFKYKLLAELGINGSTYNIGLDCTAATISIFGGADIELVDLVIRGKTISNQQHTAISISPNADYTAAENIRIIRPVIDDFTMGIIPGRGVKGLYVENPRFGRFGEISTSPGHCIYASANAKCPYNEDITVIGAYDDGEFVGNQLTPPRVDRSTPSFKFRKGRNVRMLSSFSRRPAGLFDVLGVEGGAFLGADYKPRPLNAGAPHIAIRCSNVNPAEYSQINQDVTFADMVLYSLDGSNTYLTFWPLTDCQNINLHAIVYRPGAMTTNKPIIAHFTAATGSIDLRYIAEDPHGANATVLRFDPTCIDVVGKLCANFEPRVTWQDGVAVPIEVNGRPTIPLMTAAPSYSTPGQIARADRVTWNPLAKGSGGSYLVMRNDANDGWVGIDGQG